MFENCSTLSPSTRPGRASSAPIAAQPFSNCWNEELPRRNVQEECEVCSVIDSMKKKCRNLRTQYQNLSAAYNQARKDLDLQVQRIKSGDEMLNMERKMRMETEARCQMLQHTMSVIDNRQSEAHKQQMATIAKLTDILHTSQVVVGNVASAVEHE